MSDDEQRLNPTPQQIHNTEEAWMIADRHLSEILAKLESDVPALKKYTGLSDASILFDYICSVMVSSHPQLPALNNIEITGAAALTRLAQMSRGETYDMSQFERNMKNGQ